MSAAGDRHTEPEAVRRADRSPARRLRASYHADADRGAHAQFDASPERRPGVAITSFDGHADRDTHAGADVLADAGANGDTGRHVDRRSGADAPADGHADADADAPADRNADGHAQPEPDTGTGARRDADEHTVEIVTGKEHNA